MNNIERFLSPSEAAEALGVSAKALRLYEERGLLKPIRNAAGWRAYGTNEIQRAGEIAALRALGFSLSHIDRVLHSDPAGMESALAAHEATLQQRIRTLAEAVAIVREIRVDIDQGRTPNIRQFTRAARPAGKSGVAFELPWPWGGERFELNDIRPLNYITGPLFSGKTRLARMIAERLPDTSFVGLKRSADGGEDARLRMSADPQLKARVDRALTWLVEDGATVSPALFVLVVVLEASGQRNLVVDMVEQGLDGVSQEALIAYLRAHASTTRSIFVLTRSSATLDIGAVGPDESIILCPANHSVPVRVSPYPGAPGYESVDGCLAAPEVRARTEGVVAIRPGVA